MSTVDGATDPQPHSRRRVRGALVAVVAVASLAGSCSDDGRAGQEGPSEVARLLEEQPAGPTAVEGALFATVVEHDDGFTETVVWLCDDVAPAPDVPDVPPMECSGGMVRVQSAVAEMDLDWTPPSGSRRVTPRVRATGSRRGQLFELSEVELDGRVVSPG